MNKRTLTKAIISLGLSLLSTSGFSQTTYYVSSSGNDANPGTETAPLASIQKCIDKWDGISQFTCACKGIFHEELVVDEGGPSPSLKNKITAWDTDKDGDLDDETFILDGENIRNIALQNLFGKKPDNIEISYLQFKNYFPDGGCGDDAELHFILMGCSGGTGCSDWWIHHCQFEDLGKKCNAGSHYIAIQPQNAPNLLIEDNYFKGIYAFVMRYIDGANIRFLNNYVEVQTTGLKGWGEKLDSMVISGNVFDCDGNGNPADTSGSACLGQNAINLSNNARYSLISNNVFYDCVQCIAYGTSEDYGFRDNHGHVIENNIIHRTEKVCNKYNSPIKLEDCSSYSLNTGDSMELRDMVFRNNVINYYGKPTTWNQGAAVEIMAGHPFDFASNFAFYNNSINGFRWAIHLDQCIIDKKMQPYQLDGLTLKNNIYSNIRDGFYMLNFDNTWDTVAPANIVSDYNAFYGKDYFGWQGIKTFSTWKSALGFDTHSVWCLPKYKDTILLTLDSMDICAKDAGTPLTGFTKDIDDDVRPQGSAWDIGADECKVEILSIVRSKNNFSKIKAYPNPTASLVYLEFDEKESINLTFTDVSGHILKHEDNIQNARYTIDLSNYPPGFYLINCTNTFNEVQTIKLVKN
jgi:hypothetical protein